MKLIYSVYNKKDGDADGGIVSSVEELIETINSHPYLREAGIGITLRIVDL